MDAGSKSLDRFAASASHAARSGSLMDRIKGTALGIGVYSAMHRAIEGVGGALTAVVKGGSDLNETLSKTDAVLGAAAPAVRAFADAMGSKFGLVKKDTLDAATAFGGLGKGLGKLAGGDLAKFSTDFTKLAADLSSFANIDMTEATKALTVGLSGEQSDTLKQLGVILTEATIKQYALANGIKAAGGAFTEQQKLAIRGKIIMAGLADAQGDLERTATGPANAWRKFTGIVTNLAADIGVALLPALSKGLELMNAFAGAAVAKWEASREAFGGFVDRVTYGLGSIEIAFKNWPRVMEAFWLTVQEVFTNFDALLESIPGNAAIVAVYFADNWTKLVVDAFAATAAAIVNLTKNLGAFGTALGEFVSGDLEAFSKITWTPLLDGFKATAEKFPGLIRPEFVKIGEAAGKVWDDINRRKSKFAAGLAGAAAGLGRDALKLVAPPAAAKATGQAEAKDNAAMTFGSREAASAVAKFTNKSDTNAKLLSVQEAALAAIRRVAASMEATRGKKGGVGDLADELNLGGI